MGKFEERLWSIIRNFLQVSQEDPGLLVTALQVEMGLVEVCGCPHLCAFSLPSPHLCPDAIPLRSFLQVVELQELVDAQLVAAGHSASPLRKAWRRRCLLQISNCIQDSFAPLLQRCSQLIAAGENTDRRVTEILAQADEWVAQVWQMPSHTHTHTHTDWPAGRRRRAGGHALYTCDA